MKGATLINSRELFLLKRSFKENVNQGIINLYLTTGEGRRKVFYALVTDEKVYYLSKRGAFVQNTEGQKVQYRSPVFFKDLKRPMSIENLADVST